MPKKKSISSPGLSMGEPAGKGGARAYRGKNSRFDPDVEELRRRITYRLDKSASSDHGVAAKRSRPFAFRYEAFGGILQLDHPNALIYVDQQFMRDLGYPDSPIWRDDAERNDPLSAPTEVHLALTRQCSAGCRHCHTSSEPDAEQRCDELGREGILRVVSELARMRVFQVSLGGGEGTELPWLFEVAHVVRELGMVPRLTTNGYFINEDNIDEFAVFDQVNVSIDGVGDCYSTFRCERGFSPAVEALRLLGRRGIRTGINCVVSQDNFDDLEEVFRLGQEANIQHLQLLRYKPVGRAASTSEDFRQHELNDQQAWMFFPRVMELAGEYDTPLSIDCSFTPYLYAHAPDPELLDRFGVTGCYGGNNLAGISADGEVSPCSFTPSEGRRVGEIRNWWGAEETFFSFRHWDEAAPEPCRSCKYLKLCRGGCHAVSKFVSGDVYSPDPGCPIVRDFLANNECRPSGLI